ncbi:ABC transporter permease, partial [Bifidobacterium pseudocatenulatum]|nr:ABC transporter permease [Bifidobacterium pseudocatenulatum]
KVVYVVSDLAIAIGSYAGIQWLSGHNTLTNVEELAGMMFLGWFIIFSRQIAAIEADRVQSQLILAQSERARSVEDLAVVSETV